MKFQEPEVVEMGLAEELIQEVLYYWDVEGTISPTRTYYGLPGPDWPLSE